MPTSILNTHSHTQIPNTYMIWPVDPTMEEMSYMSSLRADSGTPPVVTPVSFMSQMSSVVNGGHTPGTSPDKLRYEAGSDAPLPSAGKVSRRCQDLRYVHYNVLVMLYFLLYVVLICIYMLSKCMNIFM